MSMSVDVIYAANLKPGDLYAGRINPDAPTRQVQPFAAAHHITDVRTYTDEEGRKMMRLNTNIAGLGNLTPVRASTQVLVIRRKF